MTTIYISFDKSRKFHSWRKKVWRVREHCLWYCYKNPIWFCNRNAAIMWLKRYGKAETSYMLENQTRLGALVRVENGYVHFYNPECGLMITAESKRTHNYAVRNN